MFCIQWRTFDKKTKTLSKKTPNYVNKLEKQEKKAWSQGTSSAQAPKERERTVKKISRLLLFLPTLKFPYNHHYNMTSSSTLSHWYYSSFNYILQKSALPVSTLYESRPVWTTAQCSYLAGLSCQLQPPLARWARTSPGQGSSGCG